MFPPDQTAELSTSAGRRPRADVAAAADSIAEGRSQFPVPTKVGVWETSAVINDRYTLERRLGSGSMGEVFLASDRLLKKQVALKVLRADLAKSRATVRRFLREVALAHSVTHPNVVRIHDTGEADGLPFFSMEYLQGQTLEELVDAGRARDEAGEVAEVAQDGEIDNPPMTQREIREVSYEILSGLAAAHKAGILHRDLKPANVMLTHRGAIVMDFGVAGFDAPNPSVRPNPAEARSLVRTEAGTIFGSPAYMAPELWEGAPATVQSDLYSFGVMLYQMLAGRLPIEAPNAKAFLVKLREEKPAPIRQVRKDTPWNMALLIGRCMRTDPVRRPVSADAAARLVAPLAGRWRWLLLALGLTIALVVGLLVLRGDDGVHDQLGLPDTVAVADLGAFVRSFDTGDYEAALRQLERLEQRAPQSAALLFWRATLAHELGDDNQRVASCMGVDGPARVGSELWLEMASGACGASYTPAGPLRDLVDPQTKSLLPDAWLPLVVDSSLIPRLEAAREPGTTLLSEANAALRVLDEGCDYSEGPVLAIRWQLARVDLRLALGRVSEARTLLGTLVEEHGDSPRVLAHAATFYALTGERRLAASWAEAVVDYDPRPAMGMLLDQGRLRDAAALMDRYALSRGRHPHLPGLIDTWCGYAYRFEIEPGPARCGAVPPGLVHNLWIRARPDDADQHAMSTPERAAITQQAALNRNECLVRGENPSILTQLAPPFQTYLRQLDITAALCVDTAPSRRLARRQSDELIALTPGEPWALLISAQVHDVSGQPEVAEDLRIQAANFWRDADDDLPLVVALRELLGYEPEPEVPGSGDFDPNSAPDNATMLPIPEHLSRPEPDARLGQILDPGSGSGSGSDSDSGTDSGSGDRGPS